MEIEERKKEYELTYERIQKKHDMSIEVSRKRAEIIISDVETVATQVWREEEEEIFHI